MSGLTKRQPNLISGNRRLDTKKKKTLENGSHTSPTTASARMP